MFESRHGRRTPEDHKQLWKCQLPLDEQFVIFDQPAPSAVGDSHSVHACESPVDSREIDTLASAIRFGTGEPERRLWLKVIDDLDLPFNTRERFKNCGTMPWVEYCPDTDRVRLRSNTCKSRFCPHCRKHRQFKWRRTITAAIDAAPKATWKLITLTRKHDDTPLKNQLKHLRASFRRLRQTDIWKRSIEWGIAVIEIQYNSATRQWHPHLHILAPCKYIDYNHLRKAWIKATGGSHVIDVRKLEKPQQGVNYLAKYLGKPPSAALFHEDDNIHEYVDALKNAKMLLPFGKVPDEAKPKEPIKDAAVWKSLGTLKEVVTLAARGFRPAKTALAQLTAPLQAQRMQAPLFRNEGVNATIARTLADHPPDP